MPNVIISHDAFARRSLVRRQSELHQSCAWCGGWRRRNGRRNVPFLYRTESDGGSVGPWSKPFCSVSCYRAYSN